MGAMAQDSGLIKRGLFLFALLALIAIVVMAMVIDRLQEAAPASSPRPELLGAILGTPAAPFPAALTWTALYQIEEAFPSAPGWKIRYNAAGTLARRGSMQVPWDIIGEMLDEDRQLRNFRELLPDGRAVSDPAAAHLTTIAALRAIAEWHKKHKTDVKEVPPELQRVYVSVDKLATSPVMEIRTQAESTRKLFFR